MKKKILAVILAATMVLSVSACGNNAKTQESSGSKETGTAPASSAEVASSSEAEEEKTLYPIVEEPITIKALAVGHSTDKRADRLVWNKVSEITGINIEWTVIDYDALATYLAGNDWPDFIHNPLNNSMVNDYGVVGGRFVNIYDYLEYMPNLAQTLEEFPVAKAAATEINGEMYHLPFVEYSATNAVSRPYVRTDVLEAAGLEMPTTVEEFHDALVVIKEKNDVYPFMGNLSTDWGPMLFAAFGTETNMKFDADADGKVYTNYTSEQTRLYYTYMNQLYEEGLIHPEFLTLDNTVKTDFTKSGKLAFVDAGVSGLKEEDFADGEFHIDCCPPLTSEYDDTQEIIGYAHVALNAGMFINADSDYIVEICKMLDIMYATEEVIEGSGLHGMSFTYGLEGKDWDYGPEGSGTYEFHTPEEYGGAFNTYNIAENIWRIAGRSTALEGLVVANKCNNRARQLGFVNNVIPYQETDVFPEEFLKFTEDEQYILDNKLTDINTYYKEMQGKFVTGVVDIDTEWDNYCATLDKMGINEVLEVYQAAYERWCEALSK